MSESASTPGPAPAQRVSHYAQGSAANIVRSLAVVAALTLGLFLLVARTNAVSAPQVDIPQVARGYAAQAQLPYAYAEGLPDGWTSVSANYGRSRGDAITWNAGYQTPDGEYASIQQAQGPEEDWFVGQTGRATPVGEVTTADGRRWERLERPGKVQRTLVHRPEAAQELTTIVTGTASWEQLQLLAEHLQPVEVPRPGGTAG